MRRLLLISDVNDEFGNRIDSTLSAILYNLTHCTYPQIVADFVTTVSVVITVDIPMTLPHFF